MSHGLLMKATISISLGNVFKTAEFLGLNLNISTILTFHRIAIKILDKLVLKSIIRDYKNRHFSKLPSELKNVGIAKPCIESLPQTQIC